MASVTAVDCVTRATDGSLSGPDLVLNFELCDIVNMDQSFEHKQVKDVMELLKKRLGCKTPTIQHLVLDRFNIDGGSVENKKDDHPWQQMFKVLDTLSKNCGENVLLQIIKCDILHEMVIVMKKKLDLSVKEKILSLIEIWKDVFAEFSGKYPKFFAGLKQIQFAGVEHSHHAKTDELLCTQTCSIVPREKFTYRNTSIEDPIQDDISDISFADIKNARGIAHMLMEMLHALDPYNSQEVNQEVIAELVDQCHLYQKRVSFLVSNTRKEDHLSQGLILNDELQRVLQKYDDIVKGKFFSGVQMETLAPLAFLNQEDDELEDYSMQLCRNSRYPARQRISSSILKIKEVQNTSAISSKMSNSGAGNVSYRKDDVDRTSLSDAYDNSRPPPVMSHSSRNSSTQKLVFQKHNTEKSEPSSKYSQNPQFSNQQQRTVFEDGSASHGESRWKSEKRIPLHSNSNEHGSLSHSQPQEAHLQQNHIDLTDKFQNQTTHLDKAVPHPEKYYPIHEDASSSSTWNARKSESRQHRFLSVSSARYSEPIVKPKKTVIHKSKTTTSRQQPEYHSDSEDIPPKSASSGKNNFFKEIFKKSKKSIASKSGSSRTKQR